jgi:hypothetical protein
MRTLLAFVLLCTPALAQLDVTVTKVKALTGIVSPKVYPSLILINEASAPKTVDAAYVKVITPAKFVKVKARKSLFENADVIKLSETEYAFTGNGRYALEVTSFDPSLGIDERVIDVTFDDSPPDEPDVPDDDGPFDALSSRVRAWTKGLPKNKELSQLYADASTKLVTDPSATVNTVSGQLIESRTKVLGSASGDYSKFLEDLNADLKKRWAENPFSKQMLSDYYLEVSKGLK